jgi:predicted CXXCH cytochrome family protein
MGRARTTRHRPAWWQPAGPAALIAGGLSLALWSGCSIEKNYKVLSFFFDGVPNSAQLASASPAERQLAMRKSPTYTIHKPFAEERCAECHSGFQVASTTDQRRCLQCHQDKIDQYKFMHGPANSSACLWCHAPHESAYPSLLKTSPREVCVQCHTSRMMRPGRVAAHADPDANCLDCHSGHGGHVRYFLHDNAAPAARPGD